MIHIIDIFVLSLAELNTITAAQHSVPEPLPQVPLHDCQHSFDAAQQGISSPSGYLRSFFFPKTQQIIIARSANAHVHGNRVQIGGV